MKTCRACAVLPATRVLVVCLVVAVLPDPASALVISSGGHYVIDSRVNEVIISDRNISPDVSIEVVSGGVVEGNIQCAEWSDDCEAQVTVSGHGAVLGTVVGGDGIVVLRDYATVGVAGSGYRGGVYMSDHANLGAYRPTSVGGNTLFMTGGQVGPVDGWVEGVSVTMSAGTITGLLDGGGGGLHLDMSGGRILNGARGDPLHLKISDGDIWGGIFGIDSFGSISGGAFNANASEYLLDLGGFSGSTFTITGGLFGNISQGSGFNFRGNGTIDIWGRDLSLTDGLLTGWLLDGSYLSVTTTFSPYWAGTFNLNNVPEPGTLALLGLGLAGLGFARRRKLN